MVVVVPSVKNNNRPIYQKIDGSVILFVAIKIDKKDIFRSKPSYK